MDTATKKRNVKISKEIPKKWPFLPAVTLITVCKNGCSQVSLTAQIKPQPAGPQRFFTGSCPVCRAIHTYTLTITEAAVIEK